MKLTEVRGQATVVRTLSQALLDESTSHAYLLHGPDGVGKEYTARCFAARLLCLNADGTEPCGQCRSCEKLARSTHPDLLELMPEDEMVSRALARPADFDGRPSRSIRVGTVRRLTSDLTARPVEGNHRVALIVNAHRMGTEAQNSLLKTLEEPRPGRVLILVSPAPSALLATVRSRCQQHRFGPLSEADIGSILESQTKLETDAALELAAQSEGSAAKAFELHRARRRVGVTNFDKLAMLRRANPATVLDLAEGFKSNRPGALSFVNDLQSCLGKRVRGEATQIPALDELEQTRAAAISQYIADGQGFLSGGANITLALEDLLFELLANKR